MGLLDNLNSGIQQGMQSPLFNLGAGLIGGAQPFANPGQQLMGAAGNTQVEQQRQQQLYMQAMQMRMLQQQWPYMQQLFGQLGGLMGAPSSSQAKPSGKQSKTPSLMDAPTPIGGAPPPMIAATPQQLAAQTSPPASSTAASMPSTPAGAPSGGMDPQGLERFGLMASMFPMTQPMGEAAQKAAEFAAQYDPALQTRLAIAKSAVAQDQAMLQQAQTSGAPASTIQGLQTRLQTDLGQLHIGSMSGILTRQNPDGSWTTTDPRTGLETNTARGSKLLPGAAAAQAAMEAAKEGAGEAAKLRAQTAPAGAGGSGGASQPQTPGALPQSFQGAQAERQQNFIPPILAAPSNIPQRPGNTSLGALESFQKEQSENAGKSLEQLNDQATSAQQLVTQAEQIEAAARDFTPGRYAEAKGEIMAALQPTGILSPDQLKSLGSYQEGQKLTIQLQAMVTKQLGSREAAQVFSVMGKSIPGLTLSPDGLAKISSYLKGIARYQMAQNTFGQRLAAQGNVAGVNALQSNYQTYSNPVYYILSSAPPNVARELISNMAPAQRPKVQAGWKKAISLGLAPAPGDYE